MKVLISGASGFVGSALVSFLEGVGHGVSRLVRRPTEGPDEVFWDPAEARLEPAALEGFDAVVHLAGENISAGRWTAARRQRILDSRVHGTRLLAERMALLEHPPAVWISASAIGFYGDRGDECLEEGSRGGKGFLAGVCRSWEQATAAAPAAVRVVHLRTGLVLARDGGALARMLIPFRLGVGGILGSGEQYMSWITLDDLVAVVAFILAEDELSGPVNAVAPEPVTNHDFTAALGRALRRGTVLSAPAFALRLALGAMADELLLASSRALPRCLLDAGYVFRSPDLVSALRRVLAKSSTTAAAP